MRHRALILFAAALVFGLAAVILAYQWRSRRPEAPAVAVAMPAAPVRNTLSSMIGGEHRAITIRVNDVLGVGGFVLPGDRVDVLLTRNAQEASATDVLLQNIKVLGVDQDANERKDKPMVARAVTLEVSAEEAQRVTLGSQVGTLSLALRNGTDAGARPTRTVGLTDLRPASTPARVSAADAGAAVRVLRGTDSVEMRVARDR